MFTNNEKVVLQDLAKKVAEAAASPIMNERRERWFKHNSLQRGRPMIMVSPEGSWKEILPEETLLCENEDTRKMELELRKKLFLYEHVYHDTVIENEWIVNKVIIDSGWGLEAKRISSPNSRGAFMYEPQIKEPSDLHKLRFPEISYDEKKTEQDLQVAQDLFGDILNVKLKGITRIHFRAMNVYCKLRGLNQVMLDMYDEPNMLHDAMSFFEEGYRKMVEQYEELGLLSLNNDSSYHASGGVGYLKELPQPDYNPDKIRPCDMWASAEAQELALVSPEMHKEFILSYEKRLLEQFALSGYGCCEDLTYKLQDVMDISNMRRISISPWADVQKCAEQLQDDYIFSWKPHPAHLVGNFDEQKIRSYIKDTIEKTKGCVLEIILKDTHTCDHKPERFTRWSKIVSELVEES